MNTDTDSSQSDHSWTDLLDSIRHALSSGEVNKSNVNQILSQYKSEEDDWSIYAFFDEKGYTRNLVDSGNGFYNLMILAWNPSNGSCIHDHSNSNCFVKILAGAVREIRYEKPEEGKAFHVIGEYLRERDDVAFMDDSIGVHEMKNDTANQAVTLHLYVPPYDVCNRFNRTTAITSTCLMSYKSVYGELVQEVTKTDEQAQPCC